MKPVIKVWCLPHDQSEEDYIKLHLAIVAAVISSNIGVNSQNDMIFLLPTDLMRKVLGEEILVEFDLPHYHSECSDVLERVLDVVKGLYPKAYVQGRLLYNNGHYGCRK